jgi:hypothetical protein
MDLARVPPAPRSPSERARKILYRYQGAQVVFLMLGLGFFVMGGAAFVLINRDLPADLALDSSARSDTGVVIETALDLHTKVNNRHPTIIRFRYRVGAEELIGESSTRDPALIAAARPGGEVPIEISPSNRLNARVRGTTMSSMGKAGLAFLGMPTLGALFALLAIRSNRRGRRAYTVGKAVIARVTSSGWDRRVRINGRNPWRIAWEFTAESRPYKGAISALNVELLGELPQQKELIVLYDPANPRINTAFV